MVKTKIKVLGADSKFRTITLGGLKPQRFQMLVLGNAAAVRMKERVSKGRGSSDAPMPALKPNYRKAKWRAGLTAFRDLWSYGVAVRAKGVKSRSIGNDHMLDALRCTYADDRIARIDVSTQSGRIKARANEERAPWFGLSPKDQQALGTEFRKIFGPGAQLGVGGGVTNGYAPKWMDPLGQASAGSFVRRGRSLFKMVG